MREFPLTATIAFYPNKPRGSSCAYGLYLVVAQEGLSIVLPVCKSGRCSPSIKAACSTCGGKCECLFHVDRDSRARRLALWFIRTWMRPQSRYELARRCGGALWMAFVAGLGVDPNIDNAAMPHYVHLPQHDIGYLVSQAALEPFNLLVIPTDRGHEILDHYVLLALG